MESSEVQKNVDALELDKVDTESEIDISCEGNEVKSFRELRNIFSPPDLSSDQVVNRPNSNQPCLTSNCSQTATHLRKSIKRNCDQLDEVKAARRKTPINAAAKTKTRYSIRGKHQQKLKRVRTSPSILKTSKRDRRKRSFTIKVRKIQLTIQTLMILSSHLLKVDPQRES